MALDFEEVLSKLKEEREKLEKALQELERRVQTSRETAWPATPPTSSLPPGAGGAAQVVAAIGTTRSRRETPKEPS
jgi:hypothetical protein